MTPLRRAIMFCLFTSNSVHLISHSSTVASEWIVVLGRLRQNGSNPFEVTLNVANITLSNLTGSNVAVLHLSSKPPLSDYIQPICIDNRRTFSVGLTCWAAGWSSGRGGGESTTQRLTILIEIQYVGQMLAVTMSYLSQL